MGLWCLNLLNTVAISTEVSSFFYSNSLCIFPELESPDQRVILCCVLKKSPCCFSQELHHFTLLPTVHKHSTLCRALPTLAIFCSLCVSSLSLMVDCNLWEVIPHYNFHLFCDKPPLWRPTGLKLIYVPSVGIELTIPLPLPPGCWTSRGESPPPAWHWSFYLNFCNDLMKLSIFGEFISSDLHITYPLWRNLYLSKTVNWMLHIFYTPPPPKMQPRTLRLFLEIYSAWLLFLHHHPQP